MADKGGHRPGSGMNTPPPRVWAGLTDYPRRIDRNRLGLALALVILLAGPVLLTLSLTGSPPPLQAQGGTPTDTPTPTSTPTDTPTPTGTLSPTPMPSSPPGAPIVSG